jgi:2-amino-4-hydroxy-6-hydroxymethyldihydropteridine diphosphokinase
MGNREGVLELAIEEIGKRIGSVTNVSSKYETEPWGFISENKFLNMAVEVKTELPPYEISEKVHKIEDDLGRTRTNNATDYEDRVIDIDILMIDNIISEEKDLTLPHPKMHLREFVIFPLSEIAPDIVHPILGVSIKELKTNMTN